ncbi:SbtR family transcriptional regulator [Streptomyces apricus]|uniref:Transcriptional regulator SbtR-like C-terminal domain-containing protein n=1 Tax=Streptomyces apricus TaxID=1828112 RepID=A0A5B0BAZ2_9ACTN|nr:hypothetical protein [Streptomyces apricus]KAA0939254.1 hypothetical protein FGF04_12400 [Streptomyces apricus]
MGQSLSGLSGRGYLSSAAHAGVGERLVARALELLLDAGKAARQVRPDAGADEVMLLGSCLWRNDGGPACPERGRRVLTVVIDGLRAGTDG